MKMDGFYFIIIILYILSILVRGNKINVLHMLKSEIGLAKLSALEVLFCLTLLEPAMFLLVLTVLKLFVLNGQTCRLKIHFIFFLYVVCPVFTFFVALCHNSAFLSQSALSARPPLSPFSSYYSSQALSEALFMVGSLLFERYAVFKGAKRKNLNFTVLSRPVCGLEKISAQIQENQKM